MILLHVIGGLIGLTSGAVALSAQKGGNLHRKSGMIFVYAMTILSASGALMAARMLERVSVLAGMLTFYLVATALLTVRRGVKGVRWLDLGTLLVGLGIGILSIAFALGRSSGIDEPPPAIGLFFGAVAVLAVFGDVRMLLARSIPWRHRIARHLWRMCLALWIATASFFLGQSDEIPESLRIMPLLCTPVLLVMLLMFYWLVRVLFLQWRPRLSS